MSPALSQMMGSCLPKIYGIRKILCRNSERYELAKNHYKILLEEIPTEDKVLMGSHLPPYFLLNISKNG